MKSRPALPTHHRRATTLALGLAFTATTAFAAPTSTTSEDKQPQNYTDRGTTTTNVTVTNDYPSSNISSSNYYRDEFRNYGINSSLPSSYNVSFTTQHEQIYFPPMPPPLGEPLPATAGRPSLAKFAPPMVLANYVAEPFYAPLSPLLFAENLDRKRREKLDGYLLARTAARDALRAKIESLQTASSDARQRELTAFAALQAPVLADLETTAEEMRHNFVNGGFFQRGSDWNESRQWRLGDDVRWESAIDEYKVMIASSFFQDGLSAAQRRLLRELAMELADSLQSPSAEIALDAPGPFFYFTPETSRIRLPADLPADVAEKIQRYREQKTQLKTELRETLYKQDRTLFGYKRNTALKTLAEQQAPRFAAIEQLAEEIRIGLAPLPNPASPPALPLPRQLGNRASAYFAEKSDWQRAMRNQLEALRTQLPEDRVDYARVNDGFIIQIVPNRKSNSQSDLKRANLRPALAAFNEVQSKRYTALAREKEVIRKELLGFASGLAGGASGKSIDQLLQEFTYSFAQQERWERYRDYETAVLTPGLSPAQRRLLFGAAVEKLELPLLNR